MTLGVAARPLAKVSSHPPAAEVGKVLVTRASRGLDAA